jgi:hypothetical protein
MDVRDGLFKAGLIVNLQPGDVLLDHTVERKPTRLFVAADPQIQHLLPESGAAGEQAPLGVAERAAPCSPPYKGAGSRSSSNTPTDPPAEDGGW